MKIVALSISISIICISLVFDSDPVSSFETILPLQKMVNGSRLPIIRTIKTRSDYPSVVSCARWCGLRSTATDQPTNHLPSQRRPLYCETRRGAVTSFAPRTVPTSNHLRREGNRAGRSDRHVSRSHSDRVNEGGDGGDGGIREDEEIGFSWESFDRKGEWRTIDWTKVIVGHHDHVHDRAYQIAKIDQLCTKIPPNYPSPVELCLVRDRMVYIKRDDLLRLPNSSVSGNKARKMLALNQLPIQQFPQVIVSYGGAQSNAMLALAAIVHSKNQESLATSPTDDTSSTTHTDIHIDIDIDIHIDDKQPQKSKDDNQDIHLTQQEAASIFEHPISSRTSFFQEQANIKRNKRFVYYTKKLPRYLRKQPSGNLLRALSLGMEIVEISHEKYAQLFGGDSGGTSMPPPGLEPVVPGNSVWVRNYHLQSYCQYALFIASC